MWSIGVICYYILTSILPFNDPFKNKKIIDNKIVSSKYTWPSYSKYLSIQSKNFVNGILHYFYFVIITFILILLFYFVF